MAPDPTSFTDALVAADTLAFIDARRGSLLLHAGACVDSHGRAVVVHGGSGAGKTTLTTALAEAGLAYLTDETVCLDPSTLLIEPFPKPLTVKRGSQEVLAHLRPGVDRVDPHSGNWQVDPDALLAFGAVERPLVPIRPAVIVFPDFAAGFDGVEAAPVGRASAAYVLGEQSSALWAVEPRPLGSLERLVSSAAAYRVRYGSAFEAAPRILADLLPAVLPALPGKAAGAPPRGDPNGLGPCWGGGVDWLVLDDEAVLFDGSHLHHLDRSGTAVWLRLDGSRDEPAVADEIAAEFGADPGAVLVDVEDLVRVLRARRLLA